MSLPSVRVPTSIKKLQTAEPIISSQSQDSIPAIINVGTMATTKKNHSVHVKNLRWDNISFFAEFNNR